MSDTKKLLLIAASLQRIAALPKPIASVSYSKDGNALDVTLTNETSYYGDWIKGEGADICLYRDQKTKKVVGAHLPFYAKTLNIGLEYGCITIDVESGKFTFEPYEPIVPPMLELRLWLRYFVLGHNMRKEFNAAMVSGLRPEQIKEFRDVCLAVLNPGERSILQAQWDASEAKGFCGE